MGNYNLPAYIPKDSFSNSNIHFSEFHMSDCLWLKPHVVNICVKRR